MRLWFGLAILIVGLGAAIAADTIPATGGNIELTPMTHAHVQIEHGGKVIHIDPTSQSALAAAKPADIILVTDVHGDHMDPKAIDMLKKDSTIYVAPAALAGKFPGTTETIKNGETRTVDGVSIQAVASYNLQRGPKPGIRPSTWPRRLWPGSSPARPKPSRTVKRGRWTASASRPWPPTTCSEGRSQGCCFTKWDAATATC